MLCFQFLQTCGGVGSISVSWSLLIRGACIVIWCIVMYCCFGYASLGSLLCAVAFICYRYLRTFCVFFLLLRLVRECAVVYAMQLLSCLIFFRCAYLPRPLAGIPPAILDDYSYCCSNWFLTLLCFFCSRVRRAFHSFHRVSSLQDQKNLKTFKDFFCLFSKTFQRPLRAISC